MLAAAHVHLLALGTILFLILAAFALHTNLTEQAHFRHFLVLYQIALPAMVVMLMVRGVFQVMGSPMTRARNASISGITGITHIFMAASFVLLYLSIRNLKNSEQKTEKCIRTSRFFFFRKYSISC